jgi:hypothetical protein
MAEIFRKLNDSESKSNGEQLPEQASAALNWTNNTIENIDLLSNCSEPVVIFLENDFFPSEE